MKVFRSLLQWVLRRYSYGSDSLMVVVLVWMHHECANFWLMNALTILTFSDTSRSGTGSSRRGHKCCCRNFKPAGIFFRVFIIPDIGGFILTGSFKHLICRVNTKCGHQINIITWLNAKALQNQLSDYEPLVFSSFLYIFSDIKFTQ